MTPLETTLTAAAVYTDRARVVRRGRLSLQPGVQRLDVSGLPLALNPDSVRASAAGTARARLLGVQVERVFLTEAPAVQARQLEEQIEALQDEMQLLDSQVELDRQQKLTLIALSNHTETYATALAAGETSVEDQAAMLAALHERARQLDAGLQAAAVRRREMERRLQKLKGELEQWRGGSRRETFTASVEVDVQQAGDLEVELVYVVSGAGWRPLYDLRLQEADAPHLEVGYLAQVTQHTGEAWQDVELSLSTARPALAGSTPELDPWYVWPFQPAPPPPAAAPAALARSVMKMKSLEADEATAGAFLEMQAAPAEVAQASVESGGAAVTYKAPGRTTIPADGAPHKVTVAVFGLKPELDYVTAPAKVQAVYRRAKLVNDSPYTWLPGPANLFAGEEFIGTTHLDLIAPQGEVELYLGPDDRIKVERELKRREVDRRLLGGKRRIQYGYEIRLENLLPGEAVVTLHDQIPVSRHEEIKVRLESASPQPAEQSELNLLEWKLTLAPLQKRVVRFDFVVEYPQSMEVIGLP